MGLKNATKKTFSLGFNPLRWVGFEQLKANGSLLKNMVNRYFEPSEAKKSTKPETFETCMKRYKLTEEDLQKKIKFTRLFVFVCLGASLLMLGYTFYLFSSHLFLGGFVAFTLTLLLWAYAFREHFNYFQMKQRRLGCTFKEWLAFLLKGSK